MPQPSNPIISSDLELVIKQRLVLLSCKKFIEQLKEKGLGLTFAERTACNLILDSIERLGCK